MVTENFLEIMFTETTLLHILLLLGIPYIILYFFHRKTNFDNFPEKWELGLFIFTSGGTISFVSLIIQSVFGINFYWTYSYGILALAYLLLFIKITRYDKKKMKNYGWVLIELKNGEKFKGILEIPNEFYIVLKRDKKNKMQKIKPRKKELKWASICFNSKEVLKINFIKSIH